METTFYDDPQFHRREDIRMLKRNMTLDLDSPKSTKKPKFTALLTSPDLNMLKLASPELERLIIAQNGLVTTTPTPTQYLFPRNVTEEQEQYARGFVDALAQLHQATAPSAGSVVIEPVITLVEGIHPSTSQSVTTTTSSSNSSCAVLSCQPQQPVIMTTSSGPSHPPSMHPMPPVSSELPTSTLPATTAASGSYPPVSSSYLSNMIKEEPQTVPCMGVTPPLSPINMENQERIKLERKRLRNRIAASKCRRRKLERIARLEDKVRQLKGENSDLGSVVSKLRDQVCHLKQQVMDHVKNGCQIMITHSF